MDFTERNEAWSDTTDTFANILEHSPTEMEHSTPAFKAHISHCSANQPHLRRSNEWIHLPPLPRNEWCSKLWRIVWWRFCECWETSCFTQNLRPATKLRSYRNRKRSQHKGRKVTIKKDWTNERTNKCRNKQGINLGNVCPFPRPYQHSWLCLIKSWFPAGSWQLRPPWHRSKGLRWNANHSHTLRWSLTDQVGRCWIDSDRSVRLNGSI